MRLTLHTDYSLRLLMLLAMEPDALHTIEEIAQRYDISRNHLMKVVQTLAQAGFVQSLRGRSGGLRLAKPAAQINLGAVVRATEDSFALVECFDRPAQNCPRSRAKHLCRCAGLRTAWADRGGAAGVPRGA
jgi:Rrf2 family transcriptional regulator, nitric oxide-sensitive transcriptional repressor